MSARAWWCRDCEAYVDAQEKPRCYGAYCPTCGEACDEVPDARAAMVRAITAHQWTQALRWWISWSRCERDGYDLKTGHYTVNEAAFLDGWDAGARTMTGGPCAHDIVAEMLGGGE